MKTIHYTNSIVFDSREPCTVCKKDSLIVVERNKSLRCFHCGSGFADPLCWFCARGISHELLATGHVLSCLLKHTRGWVKYCKDFTAGPSFGTNWKKDVGERRRKAEELFAQMRFERCVYCEHRNTDSVVKPVHQGRVIENKAELNKILASKETIELYLDSDAVFCECHETAFGPSGVCGRFSPSIKNSFYQDQKTKLPRYIQALQFLELLYPQHSARETPRRGADDNE